MILKYIRNTYTQSSVTLKTSWEFSGVLVLDLTFGWFIASYHSYQERNGNLNFF